MDRLFHLLFFFLIYAIFPALVARYDHYMVDWVFKLYFNQSVAQLSDSWQKKKSHTAIIKNLTPISFLLCSFQDHHAIYIIQT